MRTMICVALVLLLAGCIPIGIRGSTQLRGRRRGRDALAAADRAARPRSQS